jgi:hypothetical protein
MMFPAVFFITAAVVLAAVAGWSEVQYRKERP